jgi:hypothetical protein
MRIWSSGHKPDHRPGIESERVSHSLSRGPRHVAWHFAATTMCHKRSDIPCIIGHRILNSALSIYNLEAGMPRRTWRMIVLITVAVIAGTFAAVWGRVPFMAANADDPKNTSYVLSDEPDPPAHMVNLRDQPHPPPAGTVTIHWEILDRVPDRTNVIIRCQTQGAVPDSKHKNTLWYYVNEGANGPHPGASGYVYGDLVRNPTKPPACTDSIITKYFQAAPPLPPVGGGQDSADERTVTLSQGPAAPSGYWYVIALAGFDPNTDVLVACFDSVSQDGQGFRSFTLHTDASGNSGSSRDCFSGDGPEHWVTADGFAGSQILRWGAAPGGSTSTGGSGSSGNSSPPGRSASPTARLDRGPAASSGYWYSITLTGYGIAADVQVTCYDSVSPGGFMTFVLHTNGAGQASAANRCFSGDGPEHWVRAGGTESNHVSWTTPGAPPQGGTGPVQPTPPVAPPATHPIFTVMNTSEAPPDGVWFRNSPHTADTNRVTGLGVYVNERIQLQCYAFGDALGPYTDSLWYRVDNLTRATVNGQANAGYLNAHYINDGKNSNQVDDGVPAC